MVPLGRGVLRSPQGILISFPKLSPIQLLHPCHWMWASSLAGFAALASAGQSPSMPLRPHTLQVGVGAREPVARPIPESAETGSPSEEGIRCLGGERVASQVRKEAFLLLKPRSSHFQEMPSPLET